jgi:1,4-dihydroxy-2-naphthoate octaprenyltransferase
MKVENPFVELRLLKVIRPYIVVGGFLGYLVGVLYSLNLEGTISWTRFALGYLIVLFEDLSTHYNNDYYDLEIDRHAPFKPFGSVNLFIEHPELRGSAFLVSVWLSVVSIILALTLVKMGVGWHLIIVVTLFNIVGWLYSAPPIRLHSRRLGEVAIALGTGYSIPAVGYILTQGNLDGVFTLFSAPLMLYGFILSLCLQVPDYEVDRAMNKKTIVGFIGRRKTYYAVLFSAIAANIVYFFLFPKTTPFFSMVKWISLIPVASSLSSILFLSDAPEQAKLFTKLNVSALFLFLVGLNIMLLLNLVIF